MTMPGETNTIEQPQGTTPPAGDQQQAQQQGHQPGGEANAGADAQQQQQQHEGEQHAEGEGKQRDERGRFKPGVQQRIDELTRARHEAEREAAYWRQRAAGGGQEPGKAPTSGQEPAPKPTPDKFEDYAQYVEALTEWKADQKVREHLGKRDSEQAQQAEKRVQQTREQAWAERQTAVREALPDYDQVMSAADVQVSQAVQEAILDSDRGPELAYHLARNPELAERLSGMSQRQVDREIGRLEATLPKSAAAPAAAAQGQKPPAVSKAPAPGRPLGAGTSQNTDPARMSMEEYRAYRAKQGARWAT